MVAEVLDAVRHAYPDIKVFLWTGYTYEELMTRPSDELAQILKQIDVLIDGPFIEEEKDLNLKLRGSKNQRIWTKQNGIWEIQNNG
jgi:anaerobic ribonucleoside-triphosphate reductase activating protein